MVHKDQIDQTHSWVYGNNITECVANGSTRSNFTVPAYDSAEQKALDTTLVTAMERAKAAEEAVLAHVFRCDVGSERYQEYGDKPDRMKLAL
ncbi:hypothetical protein ACFQL7_23920 [Halocatena marina]|uniref:Uncharacterized protein n=1 Tax=Halocatena marina TaxID=2934937 RepID=A0ABD5YYG3_9EURY